MLNKLSLKTVSGLTYYLMIVLMAVNIGVLGFLPMIIDRIVWLDIGSGYQPIFFVKEIYYYFLAVLYISGISAFIILNELRFIFRSCLMENVFIRENVKRLFRMALETGFVSLVFLTKVFVVNSIMTMVVVFVFFMAAVFCLVLALLFEQAVNYKQENDLTI